MLFCVKNSGRELFLADASLFVDDAEAFDSYTREEEPEIGEASSSTQQVVMSPYVFCFIAWKNSFLLVCCFSSSVIMLPCK